MSCVIDIAGDGASAVDIVWTDPDGEVFVPDGNRTRLEYYSSYNYHFRMSILFDPVEVSDSGDYECNAIANLDMYNTSITNSTTHTLYILGEIVHCAFMTCMDWMPSLQLSST